MEDPSFIVVEAGHLNGPNGLRYLLESEGYKVRRIFSDQAVQYASIPNYKLSIQAKAYNNEKKSFCVAPFPLDIREM